MKVETFGMSLSEVLNAIERLQSGMKHVRLEYVYSVDAKLWYIRQWNLRYRVVIGVKEHFQEKGL